jgi:hypothetical protein
VIGIGGHHELPFPQAKQVIFPHDPAHALVVHLPSTPLQLEGDPRPAVAGEFQSNPLDLVPQIQIPVRIVCLWREAVEARPADVAEFAHPQDRHRDTFLDLVLDVLAGRAFPLNACSIRWFPVYRLQFALQTSSSMRCKHPFKKPTSTVCCPTLRSS